jgi:hypothetical protein
MAKHLYLPPVTSDANLNEPAHVGQWEQNEPRILNALSQGLSVDEKAKSRGVSSVPDVWARALTFQSAIHPASHHPLQKQLLNEWRGLMSLLALREVYGYHVEIVPVPLGDNIFAQTLLRLMPPDVQLERNQRYSWSDVALIRFRPAGVGEGGEITLGALSPTTLVYTGQTYKSLLADYASPIHDRGTLKPPTAADNRDAALLLAEWLTHFQARLAVIVHADDTNPDRAVVEDLSRLIEDWLSELRTDLNIPRNARIAAPGMTVAASYTEPVKPWPKLNALRVYQELLRPILDSDDAKKQSDLFLRPNRNLGSYKNVIVISPRLLARDVQVWRTKRSTHLGASTDVDGTMRRYFDAASGTELDRENIATHDTFWIRPERYFLSDVLLTSSGRQTLLAADLPLSNVDARFVLPFKKEILDYFTPEDVINLLKPEYQTSESGVTFSFSLPVGEEMVRFERRYRNRDATGGDGVLQQIQAPSLSIFPKYLNRNWRRYYTVQYGTADVTAAPIVRRGETVERIRGDALITQITGDEPFPEGFEVRSQRNPAGLLLLTRGPEPNGLSGKSIDIGIDFGTSNTNVFFLSSNEGTAQHTWTFDFSRFVVPLFAGQVSDALADELLPKSAVSFPIPTHLKIHNPGQKDFALLDYFASFSQQYQLPPNVFADIKWDEQERKTEKYLESLLTLILIEIAACGAEKFKLRCSYPKAFSENTVTLFMNEWDSVVAKLLKDPYKRLLNLKEGSDPDQLKPVYVGMEYHVEGKAAGEFFANEITIPELGDRAHIHKTCVCLDIGGGTTDISIWHDNKIALDASILLAGRQLSALLQRDTVVRELLFSRPAAIALQEKSNEPRMFAARLNVILKAEENDIRENLIRYANRPEIDWVRRMLVIEFGAITFHTTALLTTAQKTGSPRIFEDLSESGVGMHWGGNAAKLMGWIDFGRFSDQGIAAKLLRAVIVNALKEEVRVRPDHLPQKQSPGHKNEVAGGLVVMGTRRDAPAADEATQFDMEDPDDLAKSVIMGENFEITSGPVDYHAPIQRSRLFPEPHKTSFVRTKLERLDRFIEIINFFGIKFGVFTEDTKVRLTDRDRTLIRDSVRGDFIRDASLEESHRVVEPVFIKEVRLLLDLLGQSYQRK